jgi:aldehyde dehydrogenase (NAD+)
MSNATTASASSPSDSSPTSGERVNEDFGTTTMVAELRRNFNSGRTQSSQWRKQQLRALKAMCVERQSEILDALAADLGKPRLEGFTTEVNYTIGAVDYTLSKLKKWMAPKRVSTPLITQPGVSHIHHDPLGVVLIIAPWNYPFNLLTAPLVGAIAGGNTVLLKPSEMTPETSALCARLIPHYLDGSCIKVLEGGVPETTAALKQKYDHVFYTGNGHVGRIVMTAAAKHLTPVTLELGGKSPCIVDRDANLDVTVKRIAWGKWSNAGQTCVAPDYVLAHADIHDELLAKLSLTIREFYGEDPQQSPDYGRVVNTRHHKRLTSLLASGTPVAGGDHDINDRYIAPTVLRDVEPDSAIMQQEVFGPILPVLPIKNIDQAIDFVNDRPKPLALYIFSEDKVVQRRVIQETTSGGATVNHTWMHMAVTELPFGGVGESGMGAYHGKASFDTFVHRRSVLSKPTLLDPPIAYPPYTATKEKIIKTLL